jgi:hypothetical protein
MVMKAHTAMPSRPEMAGCSGSRRISRITAMATATPTAAHSAACQSNR